MSALGRLSASIILDSAEWTVGTDRAKHIAAQTATSIDRSFKEMESSAKGALAGIAGAMVAGLGIAALKSTFDAYVEGSAKLVDLAGKAGTTVEVMSGLSLAAKLSGTSLEEVTGAMEKLAKGIVNGNKETEGAQRALGFLGLSARDAGGNLKDTGLLTEEIALKLASFKDGMAKTALATDLFGKAGANLIPFLKDLAEFGIQDAKITERQAQLAKEYSDDLQRLAIAKGALGKIISKEILPVADALVKTFLEMTTKSGGLRDQVKKLADDGSIRDFAMIGVKALGFLMDAGDGVMRGFDAIGSTLGMIVARQVNALGAIGSAVVAFIRGEYSQAWGELKTGAARDSAIVTDHGNQMRAIFEKPLAGQGFVASVEKNLAGIDAKLLATGGAAKASADGYQKVAEVAKTAATDGVDALSDSLDKSIVKLQTELDFMQRYGIQTKETTLAVIQFEVTQGRISKLLADRAKYSEADAEAMKKSLLAKAEEKDSLTTLTDITKKYIEEVAKLREVEATAVQKIVDNVQAEKDRIATFGLGREAVTRYAIAQLEAKKAMLEMTEGAEDTVRALQLQIDKLKELASLQGNYNQLEQQSKLWDEVSSKAGAFFGDLVMNGKSAFERLKDSVKSLMQEMIALFAKRWVLQLAAGGSASLGAAAANAGEGSLASSALSALGMGSSAAGSFSLFGATTATSTGLPEVTSGLLGTGGFAATIGAAGESAALALGAAAEGAAAFGAGIAAAIPVIGWVVAIGAILYSVFSKPGGGAKDGGSFNGSFDENGKFIGPGAVPGTDNGRFFTPSGQDPTLAAVGRQAGAGYYSAVRALGGTAGAFSFGLGFDTDPRGTADNRVSSEVRDASGNLLYGARDRAIGRDAEAIGPALQLEASRMVVAALKASDLPDYLAKVFDGLTVSTATQQQIDAALQQATALKSIMDIATRDPLKDIATAMEASQHQYQNALKNNDRLIRDQIKAYDGSAASATNLATATTQYYNAQLQLIAGITQAKGAIDEMLGATFRNIELAGMDKQGKYNFYQDEAARLQAEALASDDPEKIKRLAARINDDINAAFALLSPEEQSAQSGAFLSQGRATQKEIDDRLDKLIKDGADATQKAMDDIKKAILEGAAATKSAAEKVDSGGDKILEAARTPKSLIILLPDNRQEVVYLP